MIRAVLEALGFHRIHHIEWAFGWRLPLVSLAVFPGGQSLTEPIRVIPWRFRRVVDGEFHDCTASGVY
jgi:hypothetical protein